MDLICSVVFLIQQKESLFLVDVRECVFNQNAIALKHEAIVLPNLGRVITGDSQQQGMALEYRPVTRA